MDRFGYEGGKEGRKARGLLALAQQMAPDQWLLLALPHPGLLSLPWINTPPWPDTAAGVDGQKFVLSPGQRLGPVWLTDPVDASR